MDDESAPQPAPRRSARSDLSESERPLTHAHRTRGHRIRSSNRATFAVCVRMPGSALGSIDAPLCSLYSSCGQCESAASELHCGWCASSSSCFTGSALGPSAPNACAAADWTFQSCPATQPALPSPAYPTAGTVAIAMLGVISLLWLVRALLYCCCARAWSPVLGSRLRPGMLLSIRDYTRGWRLSVPFLVGGLSLGLKALALAVDTWDVTRPSFDYGSETQLFYGTMHVRFSDVPAGATDNGARTYKQFCDDLSASADPTDPDASNNLKLCRTLQATADLTLVSCCLSCLASALTVLYGLWLLAGETTIVKRGVSGWRLVAAAHLCCLSCCAYWLLSGHVLIVHMTPHGPASLGVSFPLMVSAFFVDLILLLHSNQAVGFTPAPLPASAAGRSRAYAGRGIVVEQPIPYAMMESDSDEEEGQETPSLPSSRQLPSAPPHYALDAPSAVNHSADDLAEGQSRAEGQPASLPSTPFQAVGVHLQAQLNSH